MRTRDRLSMENARWPASMTPVPREEWPEGATRLSAQPVAVWRSRRFLAMAYEPQHGAQRLSILRTERASLGWRDGITWDELQRVKAECGYGDRTAVEVFPADRDVVNVANMRHLWVLDEAPSYVWRERSGVAE